MTIEYRVPPPERVRLMPEYGVDVPLWPRSGDTDALVPSDLLERLVRWQRAFDANFDHMTGWDDDQVREQWAEEAERLVEEIRHQLPVGYVLDVDLWPLQPSR
jgi:hypothetical protein